jgi:transposase
LKELPISTREAIVKMYRVDHVFQCDIAKYYKISAALVSKLVVESQRNPQKIQALKIKKEEGQEVGEAVQRVVTDMLVRGVPIVKAEAVVQQVRRKEDIEVTISQVKTIMKDDLGLGYRVARKIPVQANTERCLVLR